MPLGSSAATATELPLDFFTVIDNSGLNDWVVWQHNSLVALDFTGVSGEQLWVKIRPQNAGVDWEYAFSTSGSGSGTYDFNVYTSNDPAEDGTTLTLLGTGSGGFGTAGWSSADNPATYWVYVEIVSTGTAFTESGKLQMQLGRHVTAFLEPSGTAIGGRAIQGRTGVALFGPQNVKGTTRVAVVVPDSDDISGAQDISQDGGLSASDVADWGPGTPNAGEPPLSYNGSLFATHTTWHKLYVNGAGLVTFTDNTALALAVPGGFTGTVMAVYSGPPNADYTNITLVSPSDAGLNNRFGHSYDAGTTSVETTGPTWLYVQHGYVGELVGEDPSSFPRQRMAFTSSAPPSPGVPDPVVGTTVVEVTRGPVEGDPDLVNGFAQVRAAGAVIPPSAVGLPDAVVGSTTVEVQEPSYIVGTPDTVAGFTTVAIMVTPDLSDNPPVTLALELTGDLIVTPRLPEQLPALVQRQTQPTVVVTTPDPLVVDGKPMVPVYLGTTALTGTAHEGAGHIRAIPPAPTWNGSGYVNPPPPTTKPWVGRWVVDDLPDPPDGGFYWLGKPSSADGTSGISSGKRQWRAHGSTPGAPSWHSIYPFKPSVRAVDSFLPDGGVVHHAKGVHFNRQFIEHMWMDWGGPRRQPFTWVVACLLASYPSAHYEHYVLDSGRDPDDVGFPRLADYQTSTPRTIADGLSYRNLLSYSPNWAKLCTRTNENGPRSLRVRSHGASRHPRMLFGVYNGGTSLVGDYGVDSHRLKRGAIDNTGAQQHRYYVLGRANGHMSQEKASHLLVFEIRCWNYAMTEAELAEQYDQLSSTYHFNRYRRV